MLKHTTAIDAATRPTKPRRVPVAQIASAGYPLREYARQGKVRDMRQKIRNGEGVKAVSLVELTDENRDKYGVPDKRKRFFLEAGHHRFAAAKLEGLTHVPAEDFLKERREP